MRSFVEELGQEKTNTFMLVNLIFKRIKQLSSRIMLGQENAPSPEEIARRVYKEIKEGKVKPVFKAQKGRKERVEKMEFREISLSEFPTLPRKFRTRKIRGRSR